ncbi:ethanolamine ammonia-lyase subunit EutB [Aeoliella mucimassa]|uniref:Ethanolamine ammonia-lyase heavy chain n=1 Tax=Aeoliella mucimassa TaxID=2527972 RepID=A0A518AVL7_9BACT|nr:ethanolamine ammonia-lyase subunit EutB [Aeoliella mucimassa]QDU58766.1 Ethanolamine ammonia-lyase heavy chain [Aeoliella mucimassa]
MLTLTTGIAPPVQGEDLFAYMQRTEGEFDQQLYAKLLGAANDYKEGDEIVGVAAADEASRSHARQLLARTKLADLDSHAIHHDDLSDYIASVVDSANRPTSQTLTVGQLKSFLLSADEQAIKQASKGLSSVAIAAVVKLMSNDELIQVGRKVFNPLPGSNIGARGYLSARVQPNSPTDHIDDIAWQVFDAWSYGVGDLLLGTNPVSSEAKSVAAVELTLQDLLKTFGIDSLMPHCVLSHIDVQAEVEQHWPGSTELWFQSIAGSDAANATFDISIEKMRQHARSRTGRFGMYFETGQGADFTNGHSHGFDMVIHESRKYGFARALSHDVATARAKAGVPDTAWVHLNDVAGFIGPEVFRSREQLVRCCLEDIVMGKLHGLCIGLDVCSTLHMDVSLDDLDWCLDQIMPANPAYLMALPTKIDPMLGYLTTGYQDHVRIREKFGYRINDAMWQFFQQLGVVDRQGNPTEHFGDPLWVYQQYCRRKNDERPAAEIIAEGRQKLAEIRRRGVFVAEGYGEKPSQLAPELKANIHRIYDDAKQSIWAEFDQKFVESVPDVLPLATQSADRTDYILHPTSGEQLSEPALTAIETLRDKHAGEVDVQIIVSDGLNALAIMESDQLALFLSQLRQQLRKQGRKLAAQQVLVHSGRVRAGYRIGETLFGQLPGNRAILHVIGERPGTGHRTFSTYITAAAGSVWGEPNAVDHNITKVVSGIAKTALEPKKAANDVARLLAGMI